MEVDKEFILKDILNVTKEALEKDSDDEIIFVELCEKAAALPEKKRKRIWVKDWRSEKQQKGSFAFLTKELLPSDPEGLKNYLRLDKSQFHYLLNIVQPEIDSGCTLFRETISVAEKLAITLRFLATGESYVSLNYQSRQSTS